MNILIGNTQEFNPLIGGVERVSTILALKLLEMGHNVFFTACVKSKYSKEYTPVVEQFILPNQKYNSSENISSLVLFCKRNKIDVILNQAGNILDFTKFCAHASKELNIPLISAIHTNPLNRIYSMRDYKFSPIYKYSYIKAIGRMCLMPFRYKRALTEERLLYKEICEISDKVVLLSKNYKVDFLDLVGKNFCKEIIPIANPSTTILQPNLTSKEKIILFVGRLDFEQKRPDRLIQVWEKLYKNFPDWKLKIAGDGPIKQNLISYVKKKKIKNVEFLGFCNVNEQYYSAAILCMTSTIEGLPMVLIEGISYGCIPIAFDSFRSVYDVIEDNKSGFVIKAYRLKDYRNKLKLLMNDAELRKKMSQEVLKASHKFELNSIVDTWICLLNKLVGEKNEK